LRLLPRPALPMLGGDGEDGGGRLSAALPLARSSGARSHGPITDMATAMGPITATGIQPITAMAIRRITATATTHHDLITAITTHGGITTAGKLGAATVCVPIRVVDGQPQGGHPRLHITGTIRRRGREYQPLIPVCTEDPVRFDLTTESLNVGRDGRAEPA
jgi:hypothetical protein